jgi:hypothetical protein
VIRRWSAVLFFVAFPAAAALTLTPSVPTAADVMTARIEVPSGCTVTTSTSVIGNVVRTDVHIKDCLAGPPPVPAHAQATFGPLPAGAYTYLVYFQEGGAPFLRDQLQFLVQPLAIPMLDVTSLVVLAFGMVAAALLLLRS